jgi:hypothetical protein
VKLKLRISASNRSQTRASLAVFKGRPASVAQQSREFPKFFMEMRPAPVVCTSHDQASVSVTANAAPLSFATKSAAGRPAP